MLLNESGDYPYYLEVMEDEANPYTILEMFENKEDLWSPLIDPSMYQRALNEFCQFGELVHFPTNKIYQWAHIVVRNICRLEILTQFYGHGENCPLDEFKDRYFYNGDIGEVDEEAWEAYKQEIGEDDDFYAMYTYLENLGFYEWAKLPNGDDALSDFVWNLGGTNQGGYNSILKNISMDKTPEELLVLINKALDMYHVRGDLASMLIKGGSSSLSKISQSAYVTEKMIKLNKIIKENINKFISEQTIKITKK